MNAVADAGITAHGAWEWLVQNWIWLLIVWMIIGGAIEEAWRRMVASRRAAGELRHRRRLEIEAVRRGVTLPPPGSRAVTAGGDISGLVSTGDGTVNVLPDAVIPRPPEARPVTGTPGPCRHGKIVPVITDSGGLEKWLCANYPRCEAEFPASVAIYAGDLKDGHG